MVSAKNVTNITLVLQIKITTKTNRLSAEGLQAGNKQEKEQETLSFLFLFILV